MHYQFAGWHWALFIAGVLALLVLDLRVFHRTAKVETFRGALGWTMLWFSLAASFAVGLSWRVGQEPTLQFATGYLIELSLSMDNVFVMALIFAYFGVPRESQHRVLFLGILGALLLRGLMIWLGVELVQHIQWMLEIFGACLLVAGLRMAWPNHEEVHPERNPVLRLARKLLPLSPAYDRQKFIVRSNGRRLFTPLMLVLIAVETTDLIFALDSIPAIFGITREPFLVFSSNVFAILGLRSLYFVLAGGHRLFPLPQTGFGVRTGLHWRENARRPMADGSDVGSPDGRSRDFCTGDRRVRRSGRFRATSKKTGLHSETFLGARIALKLLSLDLRPMSRAGAASQVSRPEKFRQRVRIAAWPMQTKT